MCDVAAGEDAGSEMTYYTETLGRNIEKAATSTHLFICPLKIEQEINPVS